MPVGEVDPDAAWERLCSAEKTLLIDVRTREEWAFVGMPDLAGTDATPALIEWQSLPDMSVNQSFAAEALDALRQSGAETALFLCRSGARSLRAAMDTAAAAKSAGFAVTCLNVAEGFEGDLDERGHRGAMNGWKARGLPWRQT